jgi:hypothetical protein
VEGPGAVRRQGPKELLHHLPALMLRRPSVSADSTETQSGLPGSRLLDRRPPHYRCPAVPGFKTSARAILMALGSSVSSLSDQLLAKQGNCELLVLPTADTSYCWYFLLRMVRPTDVACASTTVTLRQPAPSPVLRLLWLGTPLPDLPVRAPAADAFTEVPLTHFTAGPAHGGP